MNSICGVFVALAIFCSSSLLAGGGVHDSRLARAFGKNSPELRQPYRLWLPKLKIAIAANEVMFEKNGNVRVTTCSIAIFDPKDDSRVMTRIQTDSVIMVLDRPTARVEDLGDRKIVEVEIAGFPKLVVPK